MARHVLCEMSGLREDIVLGLRMELVLCRVYVVARHLPPISLAEVSLSLDVGLSLLENQFLPGHLALPHRLDRHIAVCGECEGTFEL